MGRSPDRSALPGSRYGGTGKRVDGIAFCSPWNTLQNDTLISLMDGKAPEHGRMDG